MLARTEVWSAINSGSYELPGLAAMRSALADAFACLPGTLEVAPLQPTQRVRADGERDKYFNAGQAKEYGLVDEVITEVAANK